MGLSSTQVPCHAIIFNIDTYHIAGLVNVSCYRYTLTKDRRCKQATLTLDASQNIHVLDIVRQCLYLTDIYNDSLDCEEYDQQNQHEPLLPRWRFRFVVYLMSDHSRSYTFNVHPMLAKDEVRSAQLRAVIEVDRVWLWRLARERSVDYVHTTMDTILDTVFNNQI